MITSFDWDSQKKPGLRIFDKYVGYTERPGIQLPQSKQSNLNEYGQFVSNMFRINPIFSAAVLFNAWT